MTSAEFSSDAWVTDFRNEGMAFTKDESGFTTIHVWCVRDPNVTRSTRKRGDGRRPFIVSALILSLLLGCGGLGQQNSPPKAETPIPTDAATNANLTVNDAQTVPDHG
ncbi:MAG: hypothetical protein L0H94_00880 [Nitrospira sp.]|nr:hypothetical protein [Nitrospira sp.]